MSKDNHRHNWTIEKASPSDAVAIFLIQRDCWLATYPSVDFGISVRDLRLRLEGEDSSEVEAQIVRWREGIETMGTRRWILVARLDGLVIGFVCAAWMEGEPRVGALYVYPEYQGRGIGSSLLEAALEWYEGEHVVHLHVAQYNWRAIAFYEKFGFVRTGTVESSDRTGLNPIPEIDMSRNF